MDLTAFETTSVTMEWALRVSRSKGLDDRSNPHRWWNTRGDWAQQHA